MMICFLFNSPSVEKGQINYREFGRDTKSVRGGGWPRVEPFRLDLSCVSFWCVCVCMCMCVCVCACVCV